LSGSDGGDEKRKKRDPVVQVVDGERADGRQEEKVEAGDAKQRSDDGRTRAPACGDEKHRQEKHQRDRRRIDVTAEQLERACDDGDAEDCERVANPPLLKQSFPHKDYYKAESRIQNPESRMIRRRATFTDSVLLSFFYSGF